MLRHFVMIIRLFVTCSLQKGNLPHARMHACFFAPEAPPGTGSFQCLRRHSCTFVSFLRLQECQDAIDMQFHWVHQYRDCALYLKGLDPIPGYKPRATAEILQVGKRARIALAVPQKCAICEQAYSQRRYR